MGRTQFLTPTKRVFADEVLYFLFSKLVREGLRKIMDGITPEELGYSNIHPDKIGSPRFERRRTIAELDGRLGELKVRKAEIENKLQAIGAPLAITK